MAETKPAGGAVAARKLARERMAAASAARRQREELNGSDLEAFYVLDGKIDAAAAKRDAAIAAANAAYATTRESLLDEQGAALRNIRDRSTPQAELVEMTGLTAGKLQALLKRSAPAPAPEDAPAKDAPDAAAAVVTPIGGRAAEAQPADGVSTSAATDAEREPLGVEDSAPASVS